jgi:dTDP-4-dehydrorhamnose 3,5-epimerase
MIAPVMRVQPTELPDVLMIEPDLFADARGVFFETYHERRYGECGVRVRFVQDNVSRSVRGTLRGLHYQLTQPQGKLVTVLDGRVWDVAVDLRCNSPTFRRWVGVELSAASGRQLYIPPGFAHGFCVLTESAVFHYKCTDFYNRSDERGVIWNDPTLSIMWPLTDPVLSEKDGKYPQLLDMAPEELPQ